jgi:hypothetical protein
MQGQFPLDPKNLTRLFDIFSLLFVSNMGITKMIHRQKKGLCVPG